MFGLLGSHKDETSISGHVEGSVVTVWVPCGCNRPGKQGRDEDSPHSHGRQGEHSIARRVEEGGWRVKDDDDDMPGEEGIRREK